MPKRTASNKPYSVTAVICESDLATVIQTLAGCATNFDIRPLDNEPSAEMLAPKRKPDHADKPPLYRAPDGVKMVDVIFDKFADRHNVSIEEVKDYVEEKGYQRGSASPALSKMVIEGRATRVARSRFTFAPRQQQPALSVAS